MIAALGLGEGSVSKAADWQLRLNLIGGFDLVAMDGSKINFSSKKAMGIVSYFALEARETLDRSHIAGVFWSSRDDVRARDSLRQIIPHLSNALNSTDAALFNSARDTLTLQLSQMSVYHDELAKQLSAAADIDPIALPQGSIFELLLGFDDLDPVFQQWLTITRRSWEEEIQQLLTNRLGSEERSRFDRCWSAQQLVRYDPSNEVAQRFLMWEQASSGNATAATRRYNELYTYLDQEFDTEPSQQTQALIAKIKLGELEDHEETPPTSAALAVPSNAPVEPDDKHGVPRLIIGRVRDFAEQPGGQVAAWFRSELLSAVVRFREWIVINLEEGDLSEFSDDHDGSNVYVLEGTARRTSDKYLLAMHLRNLGSGVYIWSQDYEMDTGQIGEVSRQLIRKISASMSIYVSAHRVRQLTAKAAIEKSAHDAWQKGRDVFVDWTPEGEERIREIFEQSIRLYPDYAPGYAGYVSHLNGLHLSCPGVERDVNRSRLALSYARRAVDIDPLDARNLIALAYSHAMLGRYEQAKINFHQAHNLNPNNPQHLVPCAHGLSMCGDHGTAGELCDVAEQVNPMMPGWHWAYICCVRFFRKEYALAISAAEMAQDSIPDIIGWRAAAEAQHGDLPSAQKSFGLFCETIRGSWKGNPDPTDANILDWFLAAFPIRLGDDLERLGDGMAAASADPETSTGQAPSRGNATSDSRQS